MKRLLLLIPSGSYRTADFLAAVDRMAEPPDVLVATDRHQALERMSDGRTITLDYDDLDGATAQIADLAIEHPLDAVLSVDGAGAVLAASISETLHLPGNPRAAATAAQNKLLFRERLAAAGLPGPTFRTFSVGDDPAEAAACAHFPCVLKPLSLAASRGVIRVDDERAFERAFLRLAKILSRPDAAQPVDAQGLILVEDYLPGIELAVEALMDQGRLSVLAIFGKPDQSEGPFFEESIYVTPPNLSDDLCAEAIATVADAVAALGLRQGPLHAEVRLHEGQGRMIELDARSLGGHCARSLRFGDGERLEDLILRQALGLPWAQRKRERSAAGLMMIPIPRCGELRQVSGLEAARAVPGVRDVVIAIPLGQVVEPPPEGGRYLGFIFSRGETAAEAEAALRTAHAELHFEIEEVPEPAAVG